MDKSIILSDESKRILTELKALAQQVDSAQSTPPSKEVFLRLLSGVSSCRMIDGIPENMGFENDYYCSDAKSKKAAATHLQRMFDIEDFESLQNALEEFYSDVEFRDFYGLWYDAPTFDLAELSAEGNFSFVSSLKTGEILYPYCGARGFLAWDITEKMGLCCRARAVHLI